MSRLLLPQQFLSQPQFPAPLNQARTSGLISCVMPWYQGDWARKKPAFAVPEILATPLGRAYNLTTGGTASSPGIRFAAGNHISVAAGSDFTCLIAVSNAISYSSGSNHGIFRSTSNQQGNTQWSVSKADRRHRVILNGTTIISAAGSQVTVGQNIVMGLRVKSAESVDVWWDGSLQASVGHAVNVPAFDIYYIGSQFTTTEVIGEVAGWWMFPRALTDAELRAYTVNPWQLLQAQPRTIWIGATGGEVTGTVAYTNANDTSSATGTTTVTGSAAYTNANDTSAASGTTTVTGSSATTNANDTSSATGSPVVDGASATINADDTSAASGSVGSAIVGTVAYTNIDDTASASGTTTVVGTAAASNENDTSSAVGTTTIVGYSATTNADDVCAATGTVEAVEITGTVAVTNADDVSAATGTTTVVGTSTTTNTNDTASAYGVVNNGTIVETGLTTGSVSTIRIKKPGIPVGTPDWLKTTMEIMTGRRGNKIEVPKFQALEFTATPTKAEVEALYAYTNTVRDSLEQLINRMDG